MNFYFLFIKTEWRKCTRQSEWEKSQQFESTAVKNLSSSQFPTCWISISHFFVNKVSSYHSAAMLRAIFIKNFALVEEKQIPGFFTADVFIIESWELSYDCENLISFATLCSSEIWQRNLRRTWIFKKSCSFLIAFY